MTSGELGGWIGSAIGILGGAVGTWFAVRATSGPLERAFVIRAAIVTWLGVAVFLGALLLLPEPYRWLMWIPYSIALPSSILWMNRRQARFRREEGAGG